MHNSVVIIKLKSNAKLRFLFKICVLVFCEK